MSAQATTGLEQGVPGELPLARDPVTRPAGLLATVSRGLKRHEVGLLRILVIAAILGFWQLASGPILPAYAVSDPTSVASTLKDILSSSAGWSDIKTTTIEVIVGFVLGVMLGTGMALVLGAVPLAGRVLEPLIAAFNGIPKIALAPLFLLFFGIGINSKIAIAMWGVSFVMFFNLYLGMRLVDTEKVEIVKVMGGKRRDVLLYVTVPSLASPFFAGMKASAPLAILGVIAGEFIASFDGVGHLLFAYANSLNGAGTFAALIILIVMSLLMSAVLTWLDNLALSRLGLGERRARGLKAKGPEGNGSGRS